MTAYEYHHHCIAFDLGYLYLTLSDLQRSNQGQIGKNHSKWLITLNRDEYHYHCIAFDLGYLYLTLSDIRRSNQGQIGKNHSKWLDKFNMESNGRFI